MKLKSVSGLVSYVKDIKETAKFYKDLGFIVVEEKEDYLSLRLNWYFWDFHPIDSKGIPDFQKIEKLNPKDSGMFVYLSVENVDEVYKELQEKGYQPESKPQDYPWGNREFLILDPDGYKLIFFQKK